MAKKITEANKAKYLKAKGCHCPYCGSKQISADPPEADGGEVSSQVICEDCGKTWIDVFKLADVS